MNTNRNTLYIITLASFTIGAVLSRTRYYSQSAVNRGSLSPKEPRVSARLGAVCYREEWPTDISLRLLQ